MQLAHARRSHLPDVTLGFAVQRPQPLPPVAADPSPAGLLSSRSAQTRPAAARPDALASAVQDYQEEQNAVGGAGGAVGLRIERDGLEGAWKHVEGEEAAAVQAQIAGILAGASPDAYAAAFADIAARRKDLEKRSGTVARLLAGPEKGERRKTKAVGDGLAGKALKDIARVLCSDAVPGQEKRDLVGGIIARAVCRPHGADVFFLPGLGAAQTAASVAGAETCNSTLTELMQ